MSHRRIVEGSAPARIFDAGPGGQFDEGSAFTFNGSFDDPGADEWSATVDYGDGSGSEPLALNPDKSFALDHAYGDNGTYTVTVVVQDDEGDSGSASATVTVDNVAPSLNAGTDQSALEGFPIGLGPATYSDSGFDNFFGGTLEDFTATIDWGDGKTEPASGITVIEALGGPGADTTGSILALHVYGDNGTFEVRVCVADDDSGEACGTFVVTVNNLAPC